MNEKPSDFPDRFNEFPSKYDKVCSELQECKSYNSHLLTRIIQLERNAVTNSQYSRRETIELNPVPAEIHEDVLEDSICKALSLTGVNVVPEDLQACHRMKRSDKVIVKFKCRKQKQSLMYKRKNLGTKSQELTWFFNNVINIKLMGYGRTHKIFHVTHIENLLEIDNLEEYINNGSF